MKCRTHRLRSEDGFTLIELIAVLVIMGILALAAAVKTSVTDVDLDAVARSIRSNLQFAQDLAMTHGSTYGFHRISATQYEIYEGSAGVPATHPLDGTVFVIDIAPVQFTGVTPDVPFLKSGAPDIVADATISLVGAAGTRDIVVAQDTGFVDLQIGTGGGGGGGGCSLVRGR